MKVKKDPQKASGLNIDVMYIVSKAWSRRNHGISCRIKDIEPGRYAAFQVSGPMSTTLDPAFNVIWRLKNSDAVDVQDHKAKVINRC